MSFMKYPSIENHYNEKFISRINEKYPNLKYFITEKIDGMNIQFVFENRELKGIYTRNGQDIFSAKQYDFFSKRLLILANNFFLEGIKEYKNFIVYIELYGNKIQKNIKYTTDPDNDWTYYSILDIYLNDEHRFMNFDELEKLREETLLCFAPVYEQGLTLEEALKVNVETLRSIEAEIHYDGMFVPLSEKGSFPIPIVEGVIIRPMVETQLSLCDRLIIKKKAEKFREVSKTKKTIPVSQIVVEGFEDFINENRVNSVKSKRPYELPRETGILINDVISDAIEEFQKLRRELSEEERLSIRKSYSRSVANLIRRSQK